MSSEWIEDERDTRHNLSYTPQSRVVLEEEVKPLCKILKEYYEEEQESRYRWTHNDYKREVEKRRLQKVIKVNVPKQKVFKKSTSTSVVEQYQDEEVNGDIMEKAIYKKCLYS